jgi:hypothetical protein
MVSMKRMGNTTAADGVSGVGGDPNLPQGTKRNTIIASARHSPSLGKHTSTAWFQDAGEATRHATYRWPVTVTIVDSEGLHTSGTTLVTEGGCCNSLLS